MRANPNSSMVCLFSSPSPASTPNQIQSLTLPDLMMRISTSAHPIHSRGSTEFIER